MTKNDYELVCGGLIAFCLVLAAAGIFIAIGADVYENWDRISAFVAQMRVGWIMFWGAWALFMIVLVFGKAGEKIFWR